MSGNILLQTTNETMESLRILVSQLTSRIDLYSDTLRDNYLPLSYPAPCQLGPSDHMTCLSGELHAKQIELNSSRIIIESESTRNHAKAFLEGLMDPPIVDFNDINVTATNAIAIGEEVISQLQSTRLTELAVNATDTQTYINNLSVNVSLLMDETELSLSRAHEQYNMSIVLQQDLLHTQNGINRVQDNVRELEMTQNYSEVSFDIIERMSTAQQSLDIVNTTINTLEEDTVVIGRVLDDLEDTIQETRDTLDYAEEEGT